MADIRLLPAVVYDNTPLDWLDQLTSSDPADLVAAIAEQILSTVYPFDNADLATYLRCESDFGGLMGLPQSLIIDFPSHASYSADEIGTQYRVDIVAARVGETVNWNDVELWDKSATSGGISIATGGGEFLQQFTGEDFEYLTTTLTLTDAPVDNGQRQLILQFDSNSDTAANLSVAAVNLVRLNYSGGQSAGASHFIQFCGM